MLKNQVIEAAKEGRPSFGIYVFSDSPKMIEMLGFAGLDYVRIDMESTLTSTETVHRMIQTAHAVGITPFVRVPEEIDGRINENLIHRLIKAGAMGIVLPRARTKAQVEELVKAVKGPPHGERHIGTGSFSGGYGSENAADHIAWANENIVISIQVETKAGIEAIDELVSIPGLDMVQSGRGDLSYEYDVPGQQYHPVVVEAENTMVEAGLKAGKLVSVQYYPLVDRGHIETIRGYIDRGVHALNLGSDTDLITVYRRLLADIKGAA